MIGREHAKAESQHASGASGPGRILWILGRVEKSLFFRSRLGPSKKHKNRAVERKRGGGRNSRSGGGVGFAILVGSLLVNHSISVSQTYVKTVYIIMEAKKYIRHTVAQSAVADLCTIF